MSAAGQLDRGSGSGPVFRHDAAQEILAVLAERIADQEFLRLIARMLKAGVQTPGGVV